MPLVERASDLETFLWGIAPGVVFQQILRIGKTCIYSIQNLEDELSLFICLILEQALFGTGVVQAKPGTPFFQFQPFDVKTGCKVLQAAVHSPFESCEQSRDG